MRDTRDEGGAAAVEFALLLPVLVLILLGIIEFGSTFHRTQALQAAGHEGARLAALPGSTVSDIVGRLKNYLSPIADDSHWASSCSVGDPDSDGRLCWAVTDQNGDVYDEVTEKPCASLAVDVVTVSVKQVHSIAIPFFGAPSYMLSGSGDFQCER